MLAISHSVHCVRVSNREAVCPEPSQSLGTVRICFDANKCSFSIDFNLLIIEGSLNRNFRQYGELKSR